MTPEDLRQLYAVLHSFPEDEGSLSAVEEDGLIVLRRTNGSPVAIMSKEDFAAITRPHTMIVGICGLAGSGKDTAADFLVKNDGFVKVALADPLKRIVKEVFDFSDQQLWGPSEERNKPDVRYLRKPERQVANPELQRVTTLPAEYLTPRYALQQLGTQWGRDCYPNVWVDYALRTASQLLGNPRGNPRYYNAKVGIRSRYVSDPDVYGVVISDVRFKNEIDAIHKAGGVVMRLLRGEGLKGEAGQHLSEQEMQGISLETFDYVIDNGKMSLEEFEDAVHHFAQNVLRVG